MSGPDEDDDWLMPAPKDAQQVAPNLWIGACPSGEAPPQFDHIVSVMEVAPQYQLHAHQTRTDVRLIDGPGIPGAALLLSLVALVNMLRARGPVLVHCAAGLNRSGLVTALVLMRDGMSAEAAIAHLRARRHPMVLCNSWFELWLRTHGETLFAPTLDGVSA